MLRDLADARFLFLGLEGRISAREWRWGALTVLGVAVLLDAASRIAFAGNEAPLAAVRELGFVALLFPFTALSAKRFTDRGRPDALALLVPAPSAAHTVATELGLPVLAAAFGAATVLFLAWFVLELGFAPSRPNLMRAVTAP